MGPDEAMALQVALYTLSVAAVVIAAVFVHVWLRVRAQLDRFVAAAERLEAQLTPLARDTRVAVDHLGKLSEQAQQQLAAVGAVGESLLAPARSVSRTIELLRIGGTAFMSSMWNGPRKANQPTRETVLSTS